ncbi:MAG: hypothetical protein ABIH69_04930 [bacterium]
MDVGALGGAGGAGRAEEAGGGFGETQQIVRDIFQQLEEFKTATDKEMREASLQRIQEDLERLQNGMGHMQGVISRSVDDIQSSLDSARISGSPNEAGTLDQLQLQLDQLRQQLGGTPV